jgi:hypothetical protein
MMIVTVTALERSRSIHRRSVRGRNQVYEGTNARALPQSGATILGERQRNQET